MRRVRVAAGRTPYDVVIGGGALSHLHLRRCLGRASSGVVVSSARIMRLHGEALREALRRVGFETRRLVLLPDGEAAKNTRGWEQAVRAMAKGELDRSSFVIAFGGGSIGDAAGFAAATYMRGIRVIQIPTTLLSMVDSSVGGKTGINLAEGKNLVGAFHQPCLVLADTAFLRTLPSRERQSGVYEIVKCGLLRSESLLRLIERTGGLRRARGGDLELAIAAAVRVKARIVEKDERERGDRVLLNLGHTLGHALETATSYRVFTHGEAVGYGMEFAVDLSERMGLATPASARRMLAAIGSAGRRTPLLEAVVGRVQQAIFSDKKREGAELREILLAGPRRPHVHRIKTRDFAVQAGEWLSGKTRRRRGGGAS